MIEQQNLPRRDQWQEAQIDFGAIKFAGDVADALLAERLGDKFSCVAIPGH